MTNPRGLAELVLIFLLAVLAVKAATIGVVYGYAAFSIMKDPDNRLYARAVSIGGDGGFDACEAIAGLTRKDECYAAVAGEIGKGRLNDYESCDHVKNQRGRDICYRTFSWMENFSASPHALCDRISDNCYEDKSYVVDDDGCMKNGCHDIVYLDTAAKSRNISMCDESIKSDYNRKTCYYHVAIATKNDSSCNITHENMKDACIDEIATSTKTVELCERIADLSFRTVCVASITGDMKLCDWPDIDGFKTACVRGACAAKPENENEPACIAIQRGGD